MNKRITDSALFLLGLCLGLGCQEEYKFLVVTAQVAKSLEVESNTATVLVGRTRLLNLFIEQPIDTNFTDDLPATVEPVSQALVSVSEIVLPEKTKGVYFKAGLELEYKKRHNLLIITGTDTITGSCVLPDSFSIVEPKNGETLTFTNIRVVWSKSDSAERYIIGLSPIDTANKAEGFSASVKDTFCLIPEAACKDSAGNFFPGRYLIDLMAINGAWKKGSQDLFLSGGNLQGARGIYGAVIYARRVMIEVSPSGH